MELNMDKNENAAATKLESKVELEVDLKYSQDQEINPDANGNFLNENNVGIPNSTGEGNGHGKKKRKRNRWRRNKKKSATSAGGSTNDDGISLSLSKVSSTENVCPVPAEAPVKCAYCSSTNLAKIREQSMNLPDIKERKEEEETQVPVPVLELPQSHDKILTESGDNSEKEEDKDNEEKVPDEEPELLERKQAICQDLELTQTEQHEELPNSEEGKANPPESPVETSSVSPQDCSDVSCEDKCGNTIPPESVKNVDNINETPDSTHLKSKSSNVAVIFRIGAAVFESPQSSSSVPRVISEEQLNPITGLADPDFELLEKDPVVKYQFEQDSFGELWDGQDRIHSEYDEKDKYVSITPYCVNQTRERIEECEVKEQLSDTQKRNIPDIEISSISFSEDSISPSILKVPHPSLENSDGLLTLPQFTAPVHPASLIRRAIAKIENPEIEKVAKNVVNVVITSAEEYLRTDKECEKYLQLKLETKLDEQPLNENIGEQNEEDQKSTDGFRDSQTESFDANTNNLNVNEEDTKEIIETIDEWVIDPKVIEDAVSEAVLAGKGKRSSLVKSLRECFGKKQGKSKLNKSVKKKQKV